MEPNTGIRKGLLATCQAEGEHSEQDPKYVEADRGPGRRAGPRVSCLQGPLIHTAGIEIWLKQRLKIKKTCCIVKSARACGEFEHQTPLLVLRIQVTVCSRTCAPRNRAISCTAATLTASVSAIFAERSSDEVCSFMAKRQCCFSSSSL